MKYFIVFLSSILLLACTSRTINPGYKVIGNIQGLKDKKVILFRYIDKDWQPVDTVNSSNGTFTFSGRVEIPEMYKIEVVDTLSPIPIFIDNNEINMVGNLDSLQNCKIAGSKVNEEYETFWGAQKVYSLRMDSLSMIRKMAAESKDFKKQTMIESSMEALWNGQIESIRKYVFKNRSSVVSAYLAWSRLASNSDFTQLKTITASLDTTLNKSVYVKLLKEYMAVLKKVEIGQPAIDFTMNTPLGKPVKLSSFYGKYLLVDFWASWCSPCRGENPNVVKTYKKYKNKGFAILGVSFDQEKDSWLKAIKDDKLIWTQVSDLKGWSCEAGKLYAIRSIPSNVLIDPKGIIIAKNLEGGSLEKKLKEVLKKK
jgi:peroxiredoxin